MQYRRAPLSIEIAPDRWQRRWSFGGPAEKRLVDPCAPSGKGQRHAGQIRKTRLKVGDNAGLLPIAIADRIWSFPAALLDGPFGCVFPDFSSPRRGLRERPPRFRRQLAIPAVRFLISQRLWVFFGLIYAHRFCFRPGWRLYA